MNLVSIKAKIKESLSNGADKFISAKVRDELGLNKPSIELLQSLSEGQNIDSDLHNFFKPVNSNFLTASNYKNIQKWVVGSIVVLSIVLLVLFFTMIIPKNNYSNSLGDSQIIVNGRTIKDADKDSSKAFSGSSKVYEPNVNDNVVSEDIQVENLKVSEPAIKEAEAIKEDVKKFIDTSKTPQPSVHTVKSGETLELIAQKYYGNASYQNIDKIRRANQIRNSRLINIGQKLNIPL